jgi:hypothetical protein
MMFQFMGMGLQNIGCKSLVSLGFRYFTSKLNRKQPGIETARPWGKNPRAQDFVEEGETETEAGATRV